MSGGGLASRPRVRLMTLPTPIVRLDRIEATLGERLNGVRLFAKRDDLAELGGGGNKLRKLEYLIGAAKAKGADTFITVGARQSNHARLTAAACAREGLACELYLTRSVPRGDTDYVDGGNILLDDLFGAIIHDLPAHADSLAAAQARAAEIAGAGGRAYVAPSGGSSPVGCLGYAGCADEIIAQEAQLGLQFDAVIVPNGSAGTHSGLLAGFVAAGREPRTVRSYAVLATEEEARAETLAKTNAALAELGRSDRVSMDHVVVDGSARGPGYGIPTTAMVDAVRMMAANEGLLLDPVYSGKAFAGLIADVAAGHFAHGSNLLFVMTGGTPGLFAYRAEFRGR